MTFISLELRPAAFSFRPHGGRRTGLRRFNRFGGPRTSRKRMEGLRLWMRHDAIGAAPSAELPKKLIVFFNAKAVNIAKYLNSHLLRTKAARAAHHVLPQHSFQANKQSFFKQSFILRLYLSPSWLLWRLSPASWSTSTRRACTVRRLSTPVSANRCARA